MNVKLPIMTGAALVVVACPVVAAHADDPATACHYNVAVAPAGAWSEQNVSFTLSGDGLSLSWSDGNALPYEVASIVLEGVGWRQRFDYDVSTDGAAGLVGFGPVESYAVCMRAPSVRLPDAPPIDPPAVVDPPAVPVEAPATPVPPPPSVAEAPVRSAPRGWGRRAAVRCLVERRGRCARSTLRLR